MRLVRKWHFVVFLVFIVIISSFVIFAPTEIGKSGQLVKSIDIHKYETLKSDASTSNISTSTSMLAVTFRETGLFDPSYSQTPWGVYINGVLHSTDSTVLSFFMAQGNYTYRVANMSGYVSDPSNGILNISSSSVNIAITFTSLAQEVTFRETGLSYATSWAVNVNGIYMSSNSVSIHYFLFNGNYDFKVYDPLNYSANISSGSFKVDNRSICINVSFTKSLSASELNVIYPVTFSEVGLQVYRPSWGLSINGTVAETYSGAGIGECSYTIDLPNGTYDYTVWNAVGYSVSPITGTIKVNGFSVTTDITYTSIEYPVTFSESGLPSGTIWSITLNGTVEATASSELQFTLPNGNYVFTVNSISAYSALPKQGLVSVSGSSKSEAISFLEVKYGVTFTETGLPSGVYWYVNGSGLSGYESTQASLSFNLSNGTYSFTVSNLSSFYTTTTHFTVIVSGRNVTEVVEYYHWAYITGKISPTNADLVINGKSVALTSSGSFNVSVPNGTYHVVISSSGYITYYNNFSLNSGNLKNLIVSLVPISSPSVPSSTGLYAIIGVVIAIAAIGAAAALVKRRK